MVRKAHSHDMTTDDFHDDTNGVGGEDYDEGTLCLI